MPEPRAGSMRVRRIAFAAVVAACTVASAAAILVARSRSAEVPPPELATAPRIAAPPVAAGAPGIILFKNLTTRAGMEHLAWSPQARLTGERTVTEVACERLHFGGGRGLCAFPRPNNAGFAARILTAKLSTAIDVPFAGHPSRVRVSRDGRFGAITAFIAGESYTDINFSTRTTIYELPSGSVKGELEKFKATVDGRVIDAPDVNYWGVSFQKDSSRFYATLATGKHRYLIEGDMGAATARVLRDGVECPSLSPDGTRIAFKKPMGEGRDWRFHVLDLATMKETPLAETRSIDDQIEWLDDVTVLYGLTNQGEIWEVPADGGGAPQVYLRDALSPAVVSSLAGG